MGGSRWGVYAASDVGFVASLTRLKASALRSPKSKSKTYSYIQFCKQRKCDILVEIVFFPGFVFGRGVVFSFLSL